MVLLRVLRLFPRSRSPRSKMTSRRTHPEWLINSCDRLAVSIKHLGLQVPEAKPRRQWLLGFQEACTLHSLYRCVLLPTLDTKTDISQNPWRASLRSRLSMIWMNKVRLGFLHILAGVQNAGRNGRSGFSAIPSFRVCSCIWVLVHITNVA